MVAAVSSLMVRERRDVAPDIGFEVWQKFRQREFDARGDYLPIRTDFLRRKIALELGTLDRNHYQSFCREAHAYAQSSPAIKDVFADLPQFDVVSKKYDAEGDIFKQKRDRARRLEDRLPIALGAIAFVGGAIAAGAVNQYVADSIHFQEFAQAIHYDTLVLHSERVASAVGGIMGGLVGALLGVAATREYERKILVSEKEFQEKIKQDFTTRVQDYIRTYCKV